MAERIKTIVIGGGQAGLAVSYYLKQHGEEHIILEKHQIGEAWRSKKWDSFTLVTPNWTLRLPGFEHPGDVNGYLTREEVVRYLDEYAAMFNPPVRTGIEVTEVRGSDPGFVVETRNGAYTADNVVIAVGLFQRPKIPAYSAQIPGHIMQIHSSEYRHPQQLPQGAVLVVGSGQSGCQITEELYQNGRKVYLCTGSAIRMPRPYRGRDFIRWLVDMQMLIRPVSTLKSLEERYEANPQVTGKDGGHSLNLHQFAQDGVTLLGRMQGADGAVVSIGSELKENLAGADKAVAEFKKAVDKFIAENGINAPEDDEPELRAGYDTEIITELDLDAAGITSIIWAAGYSFDFSWVRFPIYDATGYPVQHCGVTEQPGLYFVGLPWLSTNVSSLLYGVGDDARHVAEHIVSRT